jgi:serine/threonine-protein kinase
MIGQLIGQYRVTEKLGEGGMGAVYKAVDTLIDREVAIKMLRPEIARQPNLFQRFRAEAVTVAKLNHAGIATLYNFMQHGDDFFMVMEYVPGKTLEAVEREHGPLPWQIAVPLFEKILDAVQSAHDFGILHRDIKPANVMLTTWGALKVMDFGIARMLGTARMTTEGCMVGTLEYIPPERVTGKESDARGDIYSLGVVLFEMLGGRLPFQSDSEYELLRCHLQEPLPSFQEIHVDVPLEIERVVRRATAKSPDERFNSCDDFAQALQSACGNLTINKKVIVNLVGTLSVQQQPFAQQWDQPTHPSGQSVPGDAGTAIQYLRAHWKLTVAAATVLSIVAGLLIGLAARPSDRPDAAAATDHVQLVAPSAAGMAPLAAPPAPVAVPTPGQTVSSPAVIGRPVRGSTGTDKRPSTPSTKPKDIHDEALKALNQ